MVYAIIIAKMTTMIIWLAVQIIIVACILTGLGFILSVIIVLPFKIMKKMKEITNAKRFSNNNSYVNSIDLLPTNTYGSNRNRRVNMQCYLLSDSQYNRHDKKDI